MKKIILVIALILGILPFFAWGDCVCCGGEPLESGGICVKYLGSDTCQYREAGVDIEEGKEEEYEICQTTPGTTNNGQCTCSSISGGGCAYNACCNGEPYNTNEQTCYTNFGSGVTDLGHYYLLSNPNLNGIVISAELGYYTKVPNGTGGFNSNTCSCTTSGGCGSLETPIGNACCGNEFISNCQNSGGTMTNPIGTICVCSCPTGKTPDDSSNCICDDDTQQPYCENTNPATGYVTGSWNEDTCSCSCPGNSSFSNLAGCYCSAPYVVQNGTCIACGTNEVSCGTNGCVNMGNCSGSRDSNYNTYGGVTSSDCSGYQLCSVARECSPVTATNVYYGECFCSEAYLKTKCTSSQTYDTGTCTCINCSGTVVDNHCCTNTPPANAHVIYDNNACGWACDSDYTKVNNSVCCLTSVYNNCINSGGSLESSCGCSCPQLPAHAYYIALSSGSCNWDCNSGYVKNEAGAACICSNSSQKTYCEAAAPTAGYVTGTWDDNTCSCTCPVNSTFSASGCACSGTLPAHASYTSGSCNWTCDSGYVKNEAGTACVCQGGYEEVNGHCCSTASMPANAHVTCDGTSLSCICGWACNDGYTGVSNTCCLTSTYATCTTSGGTLDSNCSCTCPGTLPAHASYVSNSCDWTCNGDYIKNTSGTACVCPEGKESSEGDTCVCSNPERQTYCTNPTPGAGYVTGTWDSNTCTCTCPGNSTFAESGCACSGTLPAHASYTSGSCDWTCDSGYVKNEASTACICSNSSQKTYCEATAPTAGYVTGTWDDNTCSCTCPGNSAFSESGCACSGTLPAHASYTSGSCDWTCDSGYTQPPNQEICCDTTGLPEHAHITYTNNACDWECESDYIKDGSTCICNKTCGVGILNSNTCSCECTEISCDAPHQQISYEDDTCGCACESGYEEAETGICCPQCSSADQAAAYRENQCTCICKNADQTMVGNQCCETCPSPKEATTDEGGACACDCPLGTDNANRLLYNEANNTCVECQENAEGDYQHYHWGDVSCCPALATTSVPTPGGIATVSPQAVSPIKTAPPVSAPVLNSLSAILQKFSALTNEVPATTTTQPAVTPSGASSGADSSISLPKTSPTEKQTEKETTREAEPQKEETSQEKPPYDENGSILLKLKDIQIVSMGNAPSFCSGNLEIQNKMKGTLSTLVLNLKYDSTTIPLSFSSVEDDQILTKKLSLVGPSCRQFSSTPQVVIVKCVIKGAESDTSACRGRIKFLITD